MKLMLAPWKESYDLDSILKAETSLCQQKSIQLKQCFSSSHIWMWVLGYKEGWVPKNWCFQIVVLEKILESRLDCKKIKPVSPKGNQPWIFTEGLMLKLKLQILCLPDAKCQLIGKDHDAGKDWRQEEKEATEDEMVGWHYWLNGHEFEQNPGDGEGQGGLVSCSPWGHKESTQLSD